MKHLKRAVDTEPSFADFLVPAHPYSKPQARHVEKSLSKAREPSGQVSIP